jgi:hypothetical protein
MDETVPLSPVLHVRVSRPSEIIGDVNANLLQPLSRIIKPSAPDSPIRIVGLTRCLFLQEDVVESGKKEQRGGPHLGDRARLLQPIRIFRQRTSDQRNGVKRDEP